MLVEILQQSYRFFDFTGLFPTIFCFIGMEMIFFLYFGK